MFALGRQSELRLRRSPPNAHLVSGLGDSRLFRGANVVQGLANAHDGPAARVSTLNTPARSDSARRF